MSGIYIPGMEMPQNCVECLFNYYFCHMGYNFFSEHEELYDSRADNCPLIPVPVPDHGQLYDEDKIYEMFKEQWDDEYNSSHKSKCTWSTALSAAYDLITMLDATLSADKEGEA